MDEIRLEIPADEVDEIAKGFQLNEGPLKASFTISFWLEQDTISLKLKVYQYRGRNLSDVPLQIAKDTSGRYVFIRKEPKSEPNIIEAKFLSALFAKPTHRSLQDSSRSQRSIEMSTPQRPSKRLRLAQEWIVTNESSEASASQYVREERSTSCALEEEGLGSRHVREDSIARTIRSKKESISEEEGSTP
uniref:Uncharacterized protein n=1 Tax=Bionectria ochroleuca TaxID=29856 RepID=A0A8H7N184_BIOOC